ncbi:MAG TPA: coenzyme F420-0:L-glutamate ligase, partial [Solirubrobacteraceae bacterium]
MAGLSVRTLTGLPELHAGDDLAALIAASAEREQPLNDGALLVIAHKAVSKAEGAVVMLDEVEAGERALELAARFSVETGQTRDARAVQVVLDQSSEVLRAERGVLICRTHHGFVCANAGVDASNASAPDTLIVLPRDPDESARRIRARVRELTSAHVGVIITDSFGRAWRNGQVDVAIGLAGV